MRSRRLPLLAGCLTGVALLGGLAWQPLMTWRDVSSARAEVRAELEEVRRDNEAQRQELEEEREPAEVERRAREEFGMVRPDEEVYTVVPLDAAALELPNHWPFDVIADDVLAAADASSSGADSG